MTSYFRTRTVTCAFCLKRHSLPVRRGSVPAHADTYLDLIPVGMKLDLEALGLDECSHCGYLAHSLDQQPSDLVRAFFQSPQAQIDWRKKRSSLERAANLAVATGQDELAFMAFTAAAWVHENGFAGRVWAADAERIESPTPMSAANALRSEAAQALQRLLAQDQRDASQHSVSTLNAVRADLLRRTGQFAEAELIAAEALARHRAEPGNQEALKVRDMLVTQVRMAAAREDRACTVSEAYRTAHDHELREARRVAIQAREVAQSEFRRQWATQNPPPERLVAAVEGYLSPFHSAKRAVGQALLARSKAELEEALMHLPLSRDMHTFVTASSNAYQWPPQDVLPALVGALVDAIPAWKTRAEPFLATEAIAARPQLNVIRSYLAQCLVQTTAEAWYVETPRGIRFERVPE